LVYVNQTTIAKPDRSEQGIAFDDSVKQPSTPTGLIKKEIKKFFLNANKNE